MDKKYWFRRAGRIHGPFTLLQVVDAVAKGVVLPNDELAASESGPWMPAGKAIHKLQAQASFTPSLSAARIKPDGPSKAAVARQSSAMRPPMHAIAEQESEGGGINKNLLIAIASITGVVGICCLLFLMWYSSHSAHRSNIAAANKRVAQEIAAAKEWLSSKAPIDGQAVYRGLAQALDNELTTEEEDGREVLKQVQLRCESLTAEAEQKEACRQAATLWINAKQSIENRKVAEAIDLLRRYVQASQATEKDEAQRLLLQAEFATSDTQVSDALIQMNDQDFRHVEATGELGGDKVTHPVLAAVLAETVKRNVQKAAVQRREIRASLPRPPFERRENADLRNCVWGDSPEIVMNTAEETLSEWQSADGRERQLHGTVVIAEEPLSITYSFLDNRLVAVDLVASSNDKERGDEWNPYRTLSSLELLFSEKYGRLELQNFRGNHDGRRLGYLDWNSWRSNMPYGVANVEMVWDLPRHTVMLAARSSVGRGSDKYKFYGCHVAYSPKSEEGALYRRYKEESKNHKEVISREKRLKAADGL